MFNDKGWPAGARLDVSEIPADPTLPQLAGLLDAEHARRLLGQTLDGELEIAHCAVAYVAYRPGRSILVGYRIRLLDHVNGRHDDQLWTAKAFAGERALSSARARMRRVRPAPDSTVARFEIPGWRLLVAAFPNDLAVRGMYRVMRSSRLRRIVHRLAGAEAELVRPDDAIAKVEIVSYKPERSCLVRTAMARGPRAREPFYARAYHNDRGAAIHDIMRKLWQRPGGGGPPMVARPIGYDPETHILAQLELPGRPLGRFDDAELLEQVGETARCLAALHASEVRTERLRTPETELALLRHWAPGVVQALPEAGRALERIVATLDRATPAEPSCGWSLIHGDFSRNQVIVDGDRQALIDFDAAGRGDPLQDLASFGARLDRPRALGGVAAENSDAIAKRLRRRYEVEVGTVIDRRRLAWHEAVACARMALNSLKHLRPGWPRTVGRALAQAEDHLVDVAGGRS